MRLKLSQLSLAGVGAWAELGKNEVIEKMVGKPMLQKIIFKAN